MVNMSSKFHDLKGKNFYYFPKFSFSGGQMSRDQNINYGKIKGGEIDMSCGPLWRIYVACTSAESFGSMKKDSDSV